MEDDHDIFGQSEPTPRQSDWHARGYDREIVERVWSLATKVAGNDPEIWRKDAYGAWMHKLDYRKRASEFGWEICDTAIGGSYGIAALQPMQWQNYVDQVAATTQSRVTADGLRNSRRLL